MNTYKFVEFVSKNIILKTTYSCLIMLGKIKKLIKQTTKNRFLYTI